MTLLSTRAHGALDYATVAVFALAPTTLGLTGFAATLSYLLAAAHLLMTVVTAFPAGVVALVPFRVHGMVELAVGAALAVLSLTAFEGVARTFTLVMGIVLLLVWLATSYKSPLAD